MQVSELGFFISLIINGILFLFGIHFIKKIKNILKTDTYLLSKPIKTIYHIALVFVYIQLIMYAAFFLIEYLLFQNPNLEGYENVYYFGHLIDGIINQSKMQIAAGIGGFIGYNILFIVAVILKIVTKIVFYIKNASPNN